MTKQNLVIKKDEITHEQISEQDEEIKASHQSKELCGKSIKVGDNTLLGLSHIIAKDDSSENSDGLGESDKVDLGLKSNGSTGFELKNQALKQVKEKSKDMKKFQAKSQDGKLSDGSEVKSNISNLKQEVENLAEEFDRRMKQRDHSDAGRKRNNMSRASRGSKGGGGGLIRVNSLNIQENLLGHVKENGFKQGLTNIDGGTDSQARSSSVQPNSVVVKPENPVNTVVSISTPKEHNAHIGLQGIVFPSYPEGKFYQKGEDEELKKRIEMLEKELLKRDPHALEKQKKEEEELALKLASLSPYSNNSKVIVQRMDNPTTP